MADYRHPYLLFSKSVLFEKGALAFFSTTHTPHYYFPVLLKEDIALTHP